MSSILLKGRRAGDNVVMQVKKEQRRFFPHYFAINIDTSRISIREPRTEVKHQESRK